MVAKPKKKTTRAKGGGKARATENDHGGRCRRAAEACAVCRALYPTPAAAYAAMGATERAYVAQSQGCSVPEQEAIMGKLQPFFPGPWSLGAAFDYFTAKGEGRPLPGERQAIDSTPLLGDGHFFDQHTLVAYSPFVARFPNVREVLSRPPEELGELGEKWAIAGDHLSLVQHVAGALDLYLLNVRTHGSAPRERALLDELLHRLARFGPAGPWKKGAVPTERKAAAVRMFTLSVETLRERGRVDRVLLALRYYLGLVDEAFREISDETLHAALASVTDLLKKGGAGNLGAPGRVAELALACGALGYQARAGEDYAAALARVTKDLQIAVAKAARKPLPPR